jgi:hypothetical protein
MADLTHPAPIALFAAGATDPTAYMCSVCRRSTWTTAPDPDYALRHASLCCSTMCDTCHGPKPIRGYCSPCQRKREIATDEKRYAEATKIAADDYDGPVYNSFTDRFDASVEEALERVEQDEGEAPPYLWPVHVNTAQLDPDRIVEMLVEEMHEDYKVDDFDGLKAFCVEWNKRQTGASWEPDYSRVIVLGGEDV